MGSQGVVNFIIWRLFATLLLLFIVSLLVFWACEILPGDVAQVALGQYATPENVQALRLEMGLNEPAAQRYLHWLAGAVQGDWGRSMVTKSPVSALLSERVANTALLAGITTVIAVPLAILLGVAMAMWNGRALDRGASVVILALSATPEFLLATLLVLLFAVNLGWLPAVAYLSTGSGIGQTARALLLPTASLVVVVTAQIARMTRAILGNILTQPYIEMAILKGVPDRRIVARHALRNAVGPIANVVALNTAYLVSGIVVVETIFAYPGLARLMIDSVQSRDLPVVQACAMIFCATYVLLILLADVMARVFDPRSLPQRPMDTI
ncbi:peptide/nickel transport system permease protein [Bosea lathyri]|uniref:Peptide/nickel transport system permease protein n=1 Tax=Bosea lathyri TaxID=1036778 RepID=A0A1H6CNX9_9HYPH|nr:peptide/nickel transport system permease protein [Bosea lathyri]